MESINTVAVDTDDEQDFLLLMNVCERYQKPVKGNISVRRLENREVKMHAHSGTKSNCSGINEKYSQCI